MGRKTTEMPTPHMRWISENRHVLHEESFKSKSAKGELEPNFRLGLWNDSCEKIEYFKPLRRPDVQEQEIPHTTNEIGKKISVSGLK